MNPNKPNAREVWATDPVCPVRGCGKYLTVAPGPWADRGDWMCDGDHEGKRIWFNHELVSIMRDRLEKFESKEYTYRQPWTCSDDQKAFVEGWGLFSCSSGYMRIMRLDDPHVGRPENCRCDNTHEEQNTCCRACLDAGFVHAPMIIFDSDEAAIDTVVRRAFESDGIHRKAMALACGIVAP